MTEHYSHLSPQETADYAAAITLAEQANEAFDIRTDAARTVADDIEGDKLFGKHLLIVEQADESFKKFNFAASVLMPGRAAFERKDAEPTVPFASPEVWYSMTSEQRTKAGELRTAIATSDLKEYGVTEDTLRVVMTNENGKNKFTLIHTGSGVDIGDHTKAYDKDRSYKAVMSPRNNSLFNIAVNGVTYDTRTGMTDAVYEAKVAEARDRNVTLPDSKQLSEDTKDDWTWTMLTGEPLTAAGGYVQFRHVVGGEVNRNNTYHGYDCRWLRVCPAVEI